MKIRLIQTMLFGIFIILGGSCKQKSVEPTPTPSRGVYIVNEGAFGQSNAELSFYSPDDNSVTTNVFSGFNSGKTLGDVANRMVIAGGLGYIVVNHSNKVEVIDIETNKSVKTIMLSSSPRDIAVLSETKAYVTNQDSTVSVVNLQTGGETKKVVVGQYPEAVVAMGGKAYVCNGGFGSGRTVSVLDVTKDSVVNVLTLSDGPSYAVSGSDGRLFVCCTGYTDYANAANSTDGRLYVINTATDTIVDSLTIPGNPVGKLVLSKDNLLYLIGPGSFSGGPISKINARQKLAFVSQSFITGVYYGVGVDPETGDVYAGDAKGFASNGTVTIFGAEGVKKHEILSGVGVGPNGFAFKQ
ncbi:MAG: YncE family protein [Bacteroidota bacterium]